ncbi:MAG: choline-sulfatase, partial [Gammaproteobacteria bacterium]
MANRPNILLVMADQLAPQFLPCYGHPIVKAPTLQRLSDEGVTFDAAYTNSPLCAPSRFVMMSGRLPSKIAAWDNAVDFSAEVPTFAHYLEHLGYRTCLSGKMHFVGPDQLHGFSDRLTTDVYPSDFTWHPEWDRPNERLDWFHNMEVVTKAGPCVRSMYLDYDDEAVFHAKRYLFERAREGNDQPFMLTVSFIQPHDPYLCRQTEWDLYKDVEIDLPNLRPGEIEDAHCERLRYGYGATDVDLDDDTIRRARRAYYGSISDIDHKIAALLEALKESGLDQDTIIIFTSDHGDMLGERGMWFKMSFLEHSARVPLLVHCPQRFNPRRVSQAVSLVDLLPTLVDLASDEKEFTYPTPIDGRTIVPHHYGHEGHDEVIGEYFAEGADTPVFMIRRGNLKAIFSKTDDLKLFDLKHDPLEKDNLALKDAFSEQAAVLRSEILNQYDIDHLTGKVLESQRRRAFLKNVMRQQ